MKLKTIDTHCHVQVSQYDSDREQVIARALDEGVGMVCVGVDYATSQQAIALAHQYEGIWASVGLHPNDNLDEVYDQSIYEVLARDERVVAIGEIGLDYYRTTDTEAKITQRERFIQQLALARLATKPVIIHCRDAHEDMLGVLSEYGQGLRGVIHSFTGTLETARAYLEKGFYIGLNGILTFTDQYNEAVQEVPLDRLLLETDAPYLTPVPHRGKRNEPTYILHTAAQIARLRGVPEETVLSQSLQNTMNLFGI